jgi:hypothetical protein
MRQLVLTLCILLGLTLCGCASQQQSRAGTETVAASSESSESAPAEPKEKPAARLAGGICTIGALLLFPVWLLLNLINPIRC